MYILLLPLPALYQQITDSPGLFDTNKSPDEIASVLMQAVAAMHPGPDVILYVTKVGRYTEEEHGAYERLKALLDHRVTKHMIVVFSHGDHLKGAQISSILQSAPPQLKQVLRECNNRYVVVDNITTDKLPQVKRLQQEMNSESSKQRPPIRLSKVC